MTIDLAACRDVVDLVTGAWRTQALYVAVELGLPDHVEDGLTTPDRLATATGVDEDTVRRLMRLLVSLGVFGGNEQEGYKGTAVSETLLRDRPGSLRDLCILYGEELYWTWGYAKEALTTQVSGFEHAYGKSLIAYLGQDNDAADRFHRAVTAASFFFDQVPDIFDFSGNPTVVDLAGGSGRLLSVILGVSPTARGVLVDLEHMAPIAREHLHATVGADRTEIRVQDIFETVPDGGDVYLLSRVLGDWGTDECARLLENCRRAMSPTARLLILERVSAEDGSARLAALWDVHLHVVNRGRQRTLREYEELLSGAGLRLERTAELPMETTALIVSLADQAR